MQPDWPFGAYRNGPALSRSRYRHQLESLTATDLVPLLKLGVPVRSPPDAHLSPLPLNEQTAEPGPAPSESATRCSDRGFLPMLLDEYLELLDWTGRQIARGKQGAIPAELAPILDRLQIAADDWLELAGNFGRLFHRVAGRPESVAWQRTRRGGCFRPGHARLLGPTAGAG